MSSTPASLSERHNPWDKYNELNDGEPDGYCPRVLTHLKGPRRLGFDLFAGHCRSARALVRGGFEHVIAVDMFSPPKEKLCDRISFIQGKVEDFILPEGEFDAGVAVNGFFYCPKASLELTFRRIQRGLRAGGIFACNTLSERDIWVKARGEHRTSWIAEEDLLRLTAGFRLLENRRYEIPPTQSNEFRTNMKEPWHVRVLVLEKC